MIDKYHYIYLLESVTGPQKLAEYSFIGFDPQKVITIKNRIIEVKENQSKSLFKIDDPLEIIRKELSNNHITHNRFRLIGGAVGYISYDITRYWEKLPHRSVDDLHLPDLEMGIFHDGIIFNHIQRKAYYHYLKKNKFGELKKNLLQKRRAQEKLESSTCRPNISKKDFEKAVTKAKQYIFDGDIFQVVLSKRYNCQYKGSLINFYKNLRRINPSPYMYYLKYGDRQIIGSSPEMLMRVEKGQVETYPIAGTRPVFANPYKNKMLAKELLNDPKECAEHIMLVDLARNDIGKVSEYGSVSIPELMSVHQYSHVQHIVSRVTGKLSAKCDAFDALRSILPAGTVSGAPKVRAMEIIEELEPTQRGPYAGAVGYFSFNGNADFAITIRTLIAELSKAYIQVGAGIVADSDPQREWFETEHKAQALMKALSQSGVSK